MDSLFCSAREKKHVAHVFKFADGHSRAWAILDCCALDEIVHLREVGRKMSVISLFLLISLARCVEE
jgi:hypothetical protein